MLNVDLFFFFNHLYIHNNINMLYQSTLENVTVQSFCAMIGRFTSDVTKSEPEPRW